MSFSFSDRFLIPVAPGHAVDHGWTAATDGRPVAVTWHWTATATLAECSALLGGAEATRKGQASAHYGVGRSFEEGVDRYVSLHDRSWHAGRRQTVRWDGRAREGDDDKGARTSIGVETVNLGYARAGLPARADWLRADSPHGRWRMRIEPWTEQQVAMMIAVGKEIRLRWPEIGPRDHHGHHDLCPDYKSDPAGFPFARVLRGIYGDPSLADVWTPLWTVRRRRRALAELGYPTGPRATGSRATGSRATGTGGRWDERCDRALRSLQRACGLCVNGRWSTFVCWCVWERLQAKGIDLQQICSG